ncbi:MAG TPA: bifunctional 4-hydroxy-2-oxoglutarate aldolase/2-dehydro-3-deoxy-phosphogluconate aldolase [Bacteroidota bacterium]|jgi:2-dehydro-3-deoxyphosphogluconate aldolase/(4S)-4-hydroxy-2-oxoglutarate aldolase|nr:bifunctional 4-hydroxy-2-oxoglutarate aldolase/2-dehydro-3-deoxy-phosphogluconate aldolase [Bacteroidota bacterium]
MKEIFTRIGQIGILPVIVLERADDAEPLADALMKGGLPAAEVTFRTTAARESIERIAKTFPEMLLGAGTVLTIEQVKAARGAGAQFIVTPGLNPTIVEYCLKENIPITPGIATSSELSRAVEYGLDVVKFFPAEANGGIEYLKAISGPFRSVSFIPTGGIDETNLNNYLSFSRVLACGGSWMVKPDLLKNNQYDEITRRATQAINKMLNFSLRHVGINTADAKEAENVAGQLFNIVGFPMNVTTGSIFVGAQFEVLKRQYLGAHGHIAIGTNSIERAVAYLSRKGIGIKPETKNEKDGKLQTVYLDIEIGGFAIHLAQV